MGAPMLPRPMKPMLAMSQHLEDFDLGSTRDARVQRVDSDRPGFPDYSSFASSMSLATVFILRAVPALAAGIFNLEPAIGAP